jgi:hypothetical protein
VPAFGPQAQLQKEQAELSRELQEMLEQPPGEASGAGAQAAAGFGSLLCQACRGRRPPPLPLDPLPRPGAMFLRCHARSAPLAANAFSEAERQSLVEALEQVGGLVLGRNRGKGLGRLGTEQRDGAWNAAPQCQAQWDHAKEASQRVERR